MNSMKSGLLIPLMIALSISSSLTGCATSEGQRLSAAKQAEAVAEATRIALEEAAKQPDKPTDCHVWERSGVKLGEPKGESLKKSDNALYRANLRNQRCWAWDQNYRKGLGK